MINIPVTGVPDTTLLKPICRADAEKTTVQLEEIYRIEDHALKRWDDDTTNIGARFKLVSGKFGERMDTYRQLPPSVVRLVDALESLGFQMVKGGPYSFPRIEFWFDVSEPDSHAYYILGSTEYGQVLTTSICTTSLTKRVVDNAQRVDKTLHGVLTLCGVKELFRFFVEWTDSRTGHKNYTGPLEDAWEARALRTGMKTTRGQAWDIKDPKIRRTVPPDAHLIRMRAHMLNDLCAIGKAVASLRDEKRASKINLNEDLTRRNPQKA